MKTKKQNTEAFLTSVKELLDNANWNFEACNPRSNYFDCEKAISYLERCTFSTRSIRAELSEFWSDYLYNVKNSEIKTHEECVQLAAEMVAANLAAIRINRFTKNNWSDFRGENKKWFIDETVTFKIN